MYSNPGIDLVGYALGVRARKSFAQLMKDELFNPLGMTSSTFDQKEAMNSPSFAKGHFNGHEVTELIPMVPSGGMYSSANEMAKFISFHLAGGKIKGKQLISKELLQEMYKIQFPVAGQTSGYGLGLNVQPFYGGTFLNHSGGGFGYSTQQYWMPEYNIGVVVMANAQSGSMVQGIADRALLLMMQAKNGAVPRDKPVTYAVAPVVTLSAPHLHQLEGTYKSRNNLVTFRVEDGSLVYVFGNDKLKLEAHSPVEFTSANRKYVFSLDEAGNARGVLFLSLYETDYMPINDRPSDQVGVPRPEWQAYVGEYQGQLYGSPVTTRVFLKNGYLYVSWGGGLKLTEDQPGLFFTTEGESVSFAGDRMSLGNRPFVRKMAA